MSTGRIFRLGVDVHHLTLEGAGTKRVTENLLKQFSAISDKIELVKLQPWYSLGNGVSFEAKLRRHFLRFLWVQVLLPALCTLRHIDMLLSPEFNTPLFTFCKRAVIVHDAHMEAQREYTNPLWYYGYYIPFIKAAIRRANVIITVSEFARQELINLMRIDGRKVVVVYHGIDERFLNYSDGEGLLGKGLTKGEYILFVGTFEARKNIERLIEAFSVLKMRRKVEFGNLKLVIVGKESTSAVSDRTQQVKKLIENLNLKNDVILCGYVMDADLPKYYANAAVVAFPSLHEGFGFPILEAFAIGTPVLTSITCSMPEVARGGAMLVDPLNVLGIAAGLEDLLLNEELVKRMVEVGKLRACDFSWEKSANKIASILRSA